MYGKYEYVATNKWKWAYDTHTACRRNCSQTDGEKRNLFDDDMAELACFLNAIIVLIFIFIDDLPHGQPLSPSLLQVEILSIYHQAHDHDPTTLYLFLGTARLHNFATSVNFTLFSPDLPCLIDMLCFCCCPFCLYCLSSYYCALLPPALASKLSPVWLAYRAQ